MMLQLTRRAQQHLTLEQHAGEQLYNTFNAQIAEEQTQRKVQQRQLCGQRWTLQYQGNRR